MRGWRPICRNGFGATSLAPAQLVTIPLGVHVDDFARDPGAGRRWRELLDIPSEADVALHLGRFSLTTKLHPGPMGLALQKAAQRIGRPVYWVMFGGARKAEEAEAFLAAAAAFCPDFRIRTVDDTSPRAHDEIVSAADVFLSLSDNIQETFGLTPLEAMAAGLPCVVSDWDGYRDTVRHGVDGFRMRTLSPRPGLGSDLAYANAQRLINYEAYAGSASLFTAIDGSEAAEALASLFSDSGLQRTMGQAGRARARAVFDWQVIIPQYQALWAELARRRQAAPDQPALGNPYRPDPFQMFEAYPSAALSSLDSIALAQPLAPGEASEWLGRAFVRPSAARLPTDDEIERLVVMLSAGTRSLGALLADTPPDRRPFVERGVLWLAKFGLLRLSDISTRS